MREKDPGSQTSCLVIHCHHNTSPSPLTVAAASDAMYSLRTCDDLIEIVVIYDEIWGVVVISNRHRHR
jgi:hypothetical protein